MDLEHAGLGTLEGAFGNLHNFLHVVALTNCVAYFGAEKREEEEVAKKGHVADTTRREISRHLFNAVVSMDSLLDHAFHAAGGGDERGFRAFVAQLFEKEPALRDLREVANAMKHCVTRNSARLDGEEIVQTSLRGKVLLHETGPEVSIEIESVIHERAGAALGKAFRFWISQGQHMNALAPRIDLTIPIPEPEPDD